LAPFAIARVTPETVPAWFPPLSPMLGPDPFVQAMLTVPVAEAAVAAFALIGSYVKLIPVALMVQLAETAAVTVKVVVAVAASSARATSKHTNALNQARRGFMHK
jgi:hypothetical protein